jgi:hypothetical protein
VSQRTTKRKRGAKPRFLQPTIDFCLKKCEGNRDTGTIIPYDKVAAAIKLSTLCCIAGSGAARAPAAAGVFDLYIVQFTHRRDHFFHPPFAAKAALEFGLALRTVRVRKFQAIISRLGPRQQAKAFATESVNQKQQKENEARSLVVRINSSLKG